MGPAIHVWSFEKVAAEVADQVKMHVVEKKLSSPLVAMENDCRYNNNNEKNADLELIIHVKRRFQHPCVRNPFFS